MSNGQRGRHRVLSARTATSHNEGAWGPITSTPWPGPGGGYCSVVHTSPLVVGSTLHWLCSWRATKDTRSRRCYVLSYDVSTAQAAALKFDVPPDFYRDVTHHRDVMLTSSPAGEMCLVVAGGLEVRVWMLHDDGETRSRKKKKVPRLAHRICIDAQRLVREMEWPPLRCPEVVLLQVTEKTGVLVLRLCGVGVFAMDLLQEAAVPGGSSSGEREKTMSSSPASSSREMIKIIDDEHIPYETDLCYLVPYPTNIYLSGLKFHNL